MSELVKSRMLMLNTFSGNRYSLIENTYSETTYLTSFQFFEVVYVFLTEVLNGCRNASQGGVERPANFK